MIEPEFVFHLTKAQSLGASENASIFSADARHRLRLGENKDVELDPSFELIYVPQEQFTTPMNPRHGAEYTRKTDRRRFEWEFGRDGSERPIYNRCGLRASRKSLRLPIPPEFGHHHSIEQESAVNI
jgi:hypothetical protein